MRYKLLVPRFSGFDQGLWEQSENENDAIARIKQRNNNGIEYLHFLVDWRFAPDYRREVVRIFAKKYVEILNNSLHAGLELVEDVIDSRKEGHYTVDLIYAIVEIPDFNGFAESLLNVVSNPLYRDKIERKIRTYHTSCDGFTLNTSDNIGNLTVQVSNQDYEVPISDLTEYVIEAIATYEMEAFNDSVFEDVNSTDLHVARPVTNEAKEEYELYKRYGSYYTEYAHYHHLRHWCPAKGYQVGNWKNYVERFLTEMEELEKEIAYSTMLSAQPTLTELIDDCD